MRARAFTKNSAVIVRLDRTIQYAACHRFYLVRRCLLDTRFRGYDEPAAMTTNE
jgi:hypothetical protein